jgi:hypothetical protein
MKSKIIIPTLIAIWLAGGPPIAVCQTDVSAPPESDPKEAYPVQKLPKDPRFGARPSIKMVDRDMATLDEEAIAANAAVAAQRAASVARISRVGYGTRPAANGTVTLIEFSAVDPKSQDTIEEDLNVMSLLFQKKLEQIASENSLTFKMGIPLLLRSGQRRIDSLYLEGFGAIFNLRVNLPLMPPPVSKTNETDQFASTNEWSQARAEFYGTADAAWTSSTMASGAMPYDAEQVDALRGAILEILRQASNIRCLKPEESIVVTIQGGERALSRYTPDQPGWEGARSAVDPAAGQPVIDNVPNAKDRAGRKTLMTFRVKKSDVDAFAKGQINTEQFQQKTAIFTYLGPVKIGMETLPQASSSRNPPKGFDSGNDLPAQKK